MSDPANRDVRITHDGKCNRCCVIPTMLESSFLMRQTNRVTNEREKCAGTLQVLLYFNVSASYPDSKVNVVRALIKTLGSFRFATTAKSSTTARFFSGENLPLQASYRPSVCTTHLLKTVAPNFVL